MDLVLHSQARAYPRTSSLEAYEEKSQEHPSKVIQILSKYMRNHVKLGIFLRVRYFAVDTGHGLGKSLGDCRPALPKGWKYQMVKTQTERHVSKFFIMSMEFDKNISDWRYDCTDHNNKFDFFMRLVKWPKIAVKKCQNLIFKVNFQCQESS